jgi:centrosomal protein CEP120
VRSFKSTRRLPFPTASVVVKLSLPAELLDAVSLGGKPRAAAATPVRTNPPAAVARASEVILQNGLGHVDFGAGVMGLATALAAGPRVAAEVWHKDAYAADVLLGTATVSLAPLLREPTLDGYAPVMSDADPETPAAPRSALLLDAEAVKVGELRVVLSLAEKGPLPSWAAARDAARGPDAHDAHDAHDAAAPDLSSSVSRSALGLPSRPERAPSAVVKASTLRASMERTAAAAEVVAASRETAPTPRRASFAAGDGEAASAALEARTSTAGVADSLASMDSLRKGREYAVAWELEVWKQAQEAKWTATMRAREAERMAALEGEWRRREAQREAEHRRTQDACAATEKRLAGALAATQERERRLVAAEESLSVRREAERREMAQRMSEAQHAVRRLQQECEHQLEMEKGARRRRRAARGVARRARGGGQRARRRGGARVPRVQEGAPGVLPRRVLHAEIATLQQRRADAERTAHDAVKSRDRFKTQIQKMAKQVVALERERTYLRAALANLSAQPDGAENAENAPPKAERPRVLRGVAPPKPAPSAADFATDLFGGAEKPSEPQLEADPFLREFRESVAALDAEAAFGDEPKANSQRSRREGQSAPREPGAVPFVPAGVATRSPSKSREPSRSPARSPASRSREPSRSPARARPGEGEKKSAALDQLRSRRARAKASQERERETRPSSASRADGEVVAGANPSEPSPGSWSMESESGLKALFQSAREFEEERAEARGGGGDAKPGGEDDRRPATATATAREEGGERAKPTKPATAAAALPITAASLAEKRALEKEVRRLVSERAELMATGAYSSSDRVIELIDEKIAEITAAVAKS